ncbi:Cactus-binding C-terminus of cactin protein [Babesia microti strain RI]|uniref:Splicing factor Cactin n=1 Tax=Babesia microti (strain RI) TaxID=1133968 RepID=A0A1N6LWS4_BABMR|nr:Cactus-binding C-terminus of cactin protein [Babesia microti strain RI]SIO73322.1 Cactus-binding C-terminus of cactin protein [Babesia microti strain RI]|eukprot:XP_021337424.1 Cactus-binding C-terminus of cactin protein [Babesia microti strain RI]
MGDSRERERLIKSHFGYTNEVNPFGDTRLSQPFVWTKKDSQSNSNVNSARTKIAEIDAVKRRREQRELEEAQIEARKAEIQRQKESENYVDWEQKESEFFQKQIVVKSLLHIEQGREEFIDVLVKIIKLYQGHKFTNPTLPSLEELYTKFKEMTSNEITQLFNDIQQHESVESSDKLYWKNIAIYFKDIYRRKSQENISVEDGILKTVAEKVDQLLINKNCAQLDELERDIEKKLDSVGQGNVNISFWESVINKIPIFRAKLEFESYFSKAKLEAELIEFDNMKRLKPDHIVKLEPETIKQDKIETELTSPQYMSYSPDLLSDDCCISCITESDYEKQLLEEREQAKASQAALEAQNAANDEKSRIYRDFEAFVAKEKQQMEKDEQIMHDCVEERTNEHDRFSLRKPRFFNRVKTGYDWTKYNQMHYDEDNPPPRLVQGYKFNIFYPDLLDPTKPPRWTLERDAECGDAEFPETTIIRFNAGPPYQDLTFRIINKEWALDKHRGFKNTFEKGILQLHFTFKKMRYRR